MVETVAHVAVSTQVMGARHLMTMAKLIMQVTNELQAEPLFGLSMCLSKNSPKL